MPEHFLAIARMTFALRCEDDRVRWQWRGAMKRFLVPATTADVEISVGVLDAATRTPHGELLFDSGGVWRMFREGTGYRIECRTEVFGDEPYKVALFDDSFTRGRILLAPAVLPMQLNPLDYPLDEVLTACLLGRGRGVELHSCGVIDREGRGHLFVGVSGAGKTTTARLWEAHASGVISDDRVIVREEGGAFWMYGTPWHGEAELSLPARAPLAGVYLLEQAESNELRALPPAAAVVRLFRCAFPPFHDPAAIDFTLSFLERLAAHVPVRELRFTRDRSVVDLVLAEAA